MDLEVQHLGNGIEQVKLAGRLDTAGVEAVDARLSALTTTQAAYVVVDLSQVSFLASIGIRSLLTGARALKQRGGRMAILSPQSLVAEVLELTGITKLIPVFHDLEAASAALKAPPPGA